jgi:ribosome maturation factor RimP
LYEDSGPPCPLFYLISMGETVVERVWALAEPLVAHEGLEMVDVEFRHEGRGMVLRLFLDRQGGVTLDDLTKLSRQLGDVLDVHDAVPGRYTLEVSSPGINRRLRRPDHFRRYLGDTVRVRTIAPLEGRRNFHGRLVDVGTEGVTVATSAGAQFIRFPDIAQANYEPEPLEAGGKGCSRN